MERVEGDHMTVLTTGQPVKQRALARRQETAEQMHALSHALHAEPELKFQEHKAVRRIADIMEAAGFHTVRRAYGLDTSFEATFGTGPFRVVLCCEYDALPEIGHACGHNIIAAISTGTALALASVADDLGLTIVLLGTPAEEGGAGKMLLLEAGAFDSATISAMVHPHANADTEVPCLSFGSQALHQFAVTYDGKASHSAAHPTHAINAHAAATIAHTAIGMIRQQLEDEVRVSAFTKHGGDVTNIIPARTVVEAEVRSYSLEGLRNAKARVLACFEAGAIATGCTWSVAPINRSHDPLKQDPTLAGLWDANVVATGRKLAEPAEPIGGSTDMGNVTQYLPAIHPGIRLLGSSSVNHTTEFAIDAGGPAGDEAIDDATTALISTIIDAASDPAIREDLLTRAAARPPYTEPTR
jgi:amidohydrolase